MKLRLDYGSTGLMADFPEGNTTVIEPVHVPPDPNPRTVLQKAIQTPIGKPALRSLYRPGRKVAISVCDITRAQPRQIMIEALLAEMPGVRLSDVRILIATGTHRRNDP